jgi:hypothetical protein
MPKLVLARGEITPADELVIVFREPDNEPAAVLIHWPKAASVASRPHSQPWLARSHARRQRHRTPRTAQSEANLGGSPGTPPGSLH